MQKRSFGYIDLGSFVVQKRLVDNMASGCVGFAGFARIVQNPASGFCWILRVIDC